MLDTPKLYKTFLTCAGVSTDTRAIPPGSLFFALKGDRFDGNSFAAEALDKGASFAVVDSPRFAVSDRFIVVRNSLHALQELASKHRSQMGAKVIAVAGSNGKTTTKNLLKAVLSSTYNTIATNGNHNNHIGVPLTLLTIESSTEFAVVEIGANHPGENAALCALANPDYSIVTNCGLDHLEGFGSREGVLSAYAEVFEYTRRIQGIAFVNNGDNCLLTLAEGTRQIHYNEHFPRLKATNPCLVVDLENDTIATSLFGRPNHLNIACACAVGKFFNVPNFEIKRAIATFKPDNNRSQLINWNNNTVILDAYNANPSSVSLMIDEVQRIDGSKRMVVLGDMLELGSSSLAEHGKIVEQLSASSFDMVVLVGTEYAKLRTRFVHLPSAKALSLWLSQQKFQDMLIFVKGSRGLALEAAFRVSE